MSKGFTLLEILLSVAIITILSGVSIPVYQAFQNRNNLDIATVTFSQSLRRAQGLARASDGDTNWGVFAQSGSITLYKGTSYASRDTGFDEISEAPESIIFSGTTEFNFSKFSGLPQATGALTLTSINNETRTVTINSKGTVEY